MFVVLPSATELRSGSRVMMFTTPPMALDPKRAEPPPRITSTRSIIDAGKSSSPYMPASELKIGRLSSSTCEYCPSRPLMRSWVVPQLPQLFSTRSPDWKFIDSARLHEAVFSKSYCEATETIVGEKRLLVSVRLADTTTSSTARAASWSSKLTSIVRSARSSTSRSAGA